MSTELNKALQHALNYHSIDAKMDTPDWKLADLLEPEVKKWLEGTTDVQIVERMSEDERRKIGLEELPK